jgi:hypothetical protein
MSLTDRQITSIRTHLATGFDPFVHLCACGGAQADHSGAKHTGGCPSTGCRRFRTDVTDELAHKVVAASGSKFLDDLAEHQARVYPRPQPSPGGWHVGPSDLDSCPAAIQFREKPPEGFVPEPEDNAAAVAGTMFHDAAKRAREVLYPWREYEQPVTVPGLDRPGRFDEYDEILAEVGDTKSAGRWAWDRLGDRGPKATDWGKLSVYGYALRAAGRPVERLRLMYVSRETLEDEQFTIPYSEARARAALGKLRAFNIALDTGQALPRDPDRSGPSSDPLCARCPFRRACWNMDAAEAAGRSPESYTILGPDPAWEDIEWAARRVDSFSRDRKDAKKQETAAKDLLGGVAPGVYGEFEVVARTRKQADWKAWALKIQNARQVYLSMPEARRGDFADWVADIKAPDRIDTWYEVKRVRAHDRPASLASEQKVTAA